ncbi:MAG: hypothetical protein DRN21_02275 [Thermoplasmata archaeon]|nr:MAG: hypothetical protein DRN21_02275 [Thermoplasmata archaeon]
MMMRRAVLAVVALMLLSGCADRSHVVVMTLHELSEDYEYIEDNATRSHIIRFKTLKEGDTLIVRDVIAEKRFPEENITLLMLASQPDGGFHFSGNLTDFNVGDSIEITLHIEPDVFQMNGETYDILIFREGWDFDRHVPLPLPPSTIRRI